ncbi:universal stress protein [Rhodobaculum claviforme]|uniref:Universal stress protein n=1 Tax=Rhodobaculum claviforme TaxID=1549854 RepID=A0A934WIT9_9RHOB|nr:universal stress protein [Rhodobaculum claviforme]MBK5927301.1 universal stress protein [Rhodobaculum claviforme]
MYHHLLVPVAFDTDHKPADALAVARQLAAPGARVTVLHVMEEAPPYALTYIPADVTRSLRDALQAELDAMAQGFDDGHGVLIEGQPGRTLLDWAHEHAVDCIVIASHRPGIEDRWFMGSTASWVVGRAQCAVHVLR